VAALLVVPDRLAAQSLSRRLDLEHRLDRFDLPGRLDEASGLAFGPAMHGAMAGPHR